MDPYARDEFSEGSFTTKLSVDLQNISQYTGGASQVASQMDTGDEAAAKKSLLDKNIQSKAKMKYPAHSPALAEYGVART